MNSKYIVLSGLVLGSLISVSLIKSAAEPSKGASRIEQPPIDPTVFEASPDLVIQNEIAPKLSDSALEKLASTSTRYARLLSPELKRRAEDLIEYWSRPTKSDVLKDPAQTTVYSVAFSSDGKTLAAGSNDHRIRLWDVKTKSCVRTADIVGGSSVVSVIFAPDDGREQLIFGSRYKIGLLNIETGSIQFLLKIESANDKMVYSNPLQSVLGDPAIESLAVSPDGKTLVSIVDDTKAHLWNLSSSEKPPLKHLLDIRLAYVAPGKHYEGVAFSPNSNFLAISKGEIIEVWDVKLKQLIRTIVKNDTATNRALAFSPDGKLLAAGSEDGKIRLRNFETGELIKVLDEHAGSVRALAFSPDGKILASGANESVQLFNVRTGELIRSLADHTRAVNSIAFSSDGKTLASGSYDHTIRIWRTQNSRQ